MKGPSGRRQSNDLDQALQQCAQRIMYELLASSQHVAHDTHAKSSADLSLVNFALHTATVHACHGTRQVVATFCNQVIEDKTQHQLPSEDSCCAVKCRLGPERHRRLYGHNAS